MPKSKIRLGVIGAGMIGNVHMQAFSGLSDEVELAAVADVYMPLAEQRAAEYNIATVHVSPQALLEDPTIDAVVICVPNKFHAELSIEALKQGKHVLLEKPMSINSESARAIVEEADRSGKIVMMSHQMRWTPISRAIKEHIDSGAVGRIYNAKTGWFRKKGIPGWGTWFTRMNESGGGPLIDIGVHMLDLTLYLMGNPKPVSVYGSTYAEFGPKRQGIGNWGTPNWDGYFDVEDLATALIKMDNGATLSLEVSWAVHAAGLSEEPFVHLMGSDGGVSIIGGTGKKAAYENNEVVVSDVAPLAGDTDRILLSRHFLECIREGKQPITSAMSGYTANRIFDAIYESSRTGNEVKIYWD